MADSVASIDLSLRRMSGIGTMTARAFKAAIDNPKRFTSSTKVGPYLGLTPRQYQPGESEWIGGRRPLHIGLRETGARG
ncbi:IS110 family transposase [Bradyrhizobium sp. Ec3.3]|uniref:IS110 family transposase n=1 Tax=Bradyrhizobium sp. Ec3.3 TaxID=189753 RepID=UPI000405642A